MATTENTVETVTGSFAAATDLEALNSALASTQRALIEALDDPRSGKVAEALGHLYIARDRFSDLTTKEV